MDLVITVAWPRYDIELWRDWLVEHVGPQGEAWQWGISRIGSVDGPDLVDVMFLKQEHAVLFFLRWGS